jgi:hypothetical protein
MKEMTERSYGGSKMDPSREIHDAVTCDAFPVETRVSELLTLNRQLRWVPVELSDRLL